MIRLHGILLIGIYLGLALAFADSVFAGNDSASEDTGQVEYTRNRIDFTALFLDSAKFDSTTGVFGYTRNLSSNMSFSLRAMYLDSNAGSSGFGDTSIAFSYVPNFNVSSSPWLPTRVGTGISVVLPTGNAEERRGFDTTIVTPYTGMVYRWREKFLILPSIAYAHSFGTPVTGKDIRIGLAELGLSYLGPKKFWFGIYPGILHNFEDGETYTNTRLAIGTVLWDRIGFSIDWSDTEQIDFNFTPGTETQFTRLWNISLHVLF